MGRQRRGKKIINGRALKIKDNERKFNSIWLGVPLMIEQGEHIAKALSKACSSHWRKRTLRFQTIDFQSQKPLDILFIKRLLIISNDHLHLARCKKSRKTDDHPVSRKIMINPTKK